MKTDYKFVEYGRFSSEFEYSQLFQLCIEKNGVQTGPFGSQLHKEDYVAQGTPIITVEHLGDNRIIHIDTPFVTDDDKNRLQKYQMKEGDIIFSRVGSVDRRALVRKDEDGWLFSGRCLCVRVDKTKINPTYLSYFFGLESFKKYIRGIAVGATMPSINTKILSDVPVYYPKNLNQQKQIAKILSDLDDKIHLNNQINQTLESIAQAIFKSWFIDFEPVRAKISAKQTGQDPELAAMYAISGKSEAELEQMAKEDFAELQATAALFPDELVESELGEVPRGWEVTRFSNIVEKYIDNRGKTPPIQSEGIPLLEVKHLPEFSLNPDLNTDKKVSLETFNTWFRAHLQENDLIMSTVGTIGRLCIVPANRTLAIAQNILGLRFKLNKVNPLFMYYQMNSAKFRNDVDARLVITVQSSIKRKDLETIDLLQPDINIQNIFAEKIKPFVLSQQSDESLKLIDIRDALLPKLLSGEIDVSDLQSEGD